MVPFSQSYCYFVKLQPIISLSTFFAPFLFCWVSLENFPSKRFILKKRERERDQNQPVESGFYLFRCKVEYLGKVATYKMDTNDLVNVLYILAGNKDFTRDIYYD